jgi:hypothetical protein
MSTLSSALKKTRQAERNSKDYQNSDYRLTQKEQETLNITRILLVLPILLILVLYAVS